MCGGAAANFEKLGDEGVVILNVAETGRRVAVVVVVRPVDGGHFVMLVGHVVHPERREAEAG